MRVAVNASFLPAVPSGIGTYTRGLVDYLSACGDETLVYAPEPMGLDGRGGAKWRRSPAGLRGGKVASIARVAGWYQTALPFRLARDKADVLLSTMQEGTLVPVCPQVVVVHDIIPLLFPDSGRAWAAYYRWILPLVLGASTRVVADSNHTKRDLEQYLAVSGDKISVIYPWLDPLFLSDDPGTLPNGLAGRSYFLFVGKCTPYKNLETVIRAFASVLRAIPHELVCVLSAGRAPERQHRAEMIALASRLGVGERLRVYSKLTRQEMLFLYRNATALLLVSKYEGFGYPPLEAMAVGTPAVVSDSTSLAEVAGAAAVRVTSTDVSGVANSIVRLATDQGYRSSLVGPGMARAREFSEERAGREIRSVLMRSAGFDGGS